MTVFWNNFSLRIHFTIVAAINPFTDTFGAKAKCRYYKSYPIRCISACKCTWKYVCLYQIILIQTCGKWLSFHSKQLIVIDFDVIWSVIYDRYLCQIRYYFNLFNVIIERVPKECERITIYCVRLTLNSSIEYIV